MSDVYIIHYWGMSKGSLNSLSLSPGNSYDDTERVMAAGYENGDVKLFDLKAMKLLWETNVKNGVKLKAEKEIASAFFYKVIISHRPNQPSFCRPLSFRCVVSNLIEKILR